jgi:hypothetical protein
VTPNIGQLSALATAPIGLIGNCVGFDGPDDSEVIVWPEGTRWDATTNQVVMPDAARYSMGDQVALAGGQVNVGDIPRLGDFAPDLLAAVETCANLGPTVWYASEPH